MSDIGEMRKTLLKRILEGPGTAPSSDRRAAFNDRCGAGPLAALVDKVARHADRITDQDIIAAKGSGLSEDQIFEIVVCAAVGQANRQYETALATLDVTAGKE